MISPYDVRLKMMRANASYFADRLVVYLAIAAIIAMCMGWLAGPETLLEVFK